MSSIAGWRKPLITICSWILTVIRLILGVTLCVAVIIAFIYAVIHREPVFPEREEWMSSLANVLDEIHDEAPSIIATYNRAEDQYREGGWIIVNQTDFQLANECVCIEGDMRPTTSQEVAYVLVVGAPIRNSLGHWMRRGGGWAFERFQDHYKLYLIDWHRRCLVDTDVVKTDAYSNPIWKRDALREDQTKCRGTILNWLMYRGIIDYRWDSYSSDRPLERAAREGNKKLVSFLLRKDFDDEDKQRAIHVALENSHAEIAELLLKQGAKTDIFVSAGLGDIDSLKALLRVDSTLVKRRTRSSNTSLHIAAANGHLRIVDILLKEGADVNSKTYLGRELRHATPLDKAVANGHFDVAKFLREYEAKEPSTDEATP